MTVWFAQNSTVNINSANEWNDIAAGSGNALTWANLAAGDILCANGKTAIAVNVAVTCLRISTFAEVGSSDTGTTGGEFTCAGTIAITANVRAGSTPCLVIANGAVVTGIGDSTGGESVSAHGISTSGTVTATNATGGAGLYAYGITVGAATAIITVTGTATGGAGYGAEGVSIGYALSSTASNIANAVGSPTMAGAHGLGANSSFTVTVGNAKGGGVFGANGVSSASATIVLNGTDLTGVGYPVAVSGTASLKVAAGVPLQFSNAAGALKVFCPVPALGTVKQDTVVYTSAAGSVYGTRVDADKADVKAGVKYGDPDNQLTGELVASGVRRGGALRGA